ncbi:MAG: FMN reductase [Candidatus Omnitrophica bacterium CG11_big_fil_rev_8_21_14_0_20_41_12]|nr:MAG: FMN reductase [Candidatus Omnitrophica bacterium CG11_big_fil_rev_8_21_14_0_20_41_12]
MKVVAFNTSARADGNTAILIKQFFKQLEREGIKTKLIQLAGQKISGCIGCGKCMTNKDKKCAVTDDLVNEYIAQMLKSDGIIIGSPTYFADCTASAKALIERAGMVSRANNNMLMRKVGAAVVAVRRGGAIHAFDTINHFFTISEMIIVGSLYWNIGIGRQIGDVEKDEEGLNTMDILGKNMAWLLKKICK